MAPKTKLHLWSERLLIGLTVLLFFNALMVLVVSGSKPLTFMHDFRQTQTAITSFWFLKDGFSVAYQTPVLGAPWAIPFEFPVYQSLAAIVAKLGVPLDFAGRLVSWCFFVACLWPLRVLQKAIGFSDWWFWAASAMFLASPIYLFWGTTFMIETAALFFAFAHAALLIRFLQEGGGIRFVFSAMLGALAVLTKATTLPAFSLLAGLGFLWIIWTWHKTGKLLQQKLRAGLATVLLLFPYPIGLTWVGVSDSIKSQNPIGEFLTSEKLSSWNYGTLDMRLSERFWGELLPQRMLVDTLGTAAAVLLLIVLLLQIFPKLNAGLSSPRARLVALGSLGFFTPLMLFTNLHLVHNYYQVANAVFVILVLSVIAFDLLDRGRVVLSTAMVVFVVASQLNTFFDRFYPGVKSPPFPNHYLIALEARDQIPDNSGVYVFGIDWNSTAPYYTERRAFAPPDWIPKDIVGSLISSPETTLGGLPLGGVIWCKYKELSFDDSIEQLVASMNEVSEVGACKLYQS